MNSDHLNIRPKKTKGARFWICLSFFSPLKTKKRIMDSQSDILFVLSKASSWHCSTFCSYLPLFDTATTFGAAYKANWLYLYLLLPHSSSACWPLWKYIFTTLSRCLVCYWLCIDLLIVLKNDSSTWSFVEWPSQWRCLGTATLRSIVFGGTAQSVWQWLLDTCLWKNTCPSL